MDSIKPEYLSRVTPVTALHCAEVLAVRSDGYQLGGDWGNLVARRAASCQLLPEVGDSVLLAGELPEHAYILAVLERRSSAALCTSLGEGVCLRVESAGKLAITSTQSLHLQSDDIGIVGRTGRLLLGQVRAIANEALFSIKSSRLVGDVFESSVGRLTQWLGASQRTIKTLDQTRSGEIDYRAEQALLLHGHQLLASADKLARIDGEQVHIG